MRLGQTRHGAVLDFQCERRGENGLFRFEHNVWAHAEILKLLRSALDCRVFDRIDSVYARYCEDKGRVPQHRKKR